MNALRCLLTHGKSRWLLRYTWDEGLTGVRICMTCQCINVWPWGWYEQLDRERRIVAQLEQWLRSDIGSQERAT